MRTNNRKKQPRKMSGKMKKKLAGLFGLVVLALVCLGIRITYINANDGAQYQQQVLSQSQQKYDSRTLPFKRGDIVDSNGTVLASSEKVYNLILDCKVVNSSEDYKEPTITALNSVLGVDENTVRTLLEDEETQSSQYQILVRDLSIKDKKAFEAYTDTSSEDLSKTELKEKQNVKGVWFEEKYKRVYPLNALACDLIGFTYGDNQADWGIEGYYNSVLNGANGRTYGYFNDDSTVEQTIIDPEDGYSLQLSMDVSIQQIIEKYANDFITNMSANGAPAAANIGIIIQDPNNGEILGMYSNGSYDLNNPSDLTGFYAQEQIDAMNDQQKTDALSTIWQNYCISSAYEPGSTIKPVTVASALEDASLDGSETFICDGAEVVGGVTIKCSETSGHGEETLSDAIKNSCNDALMQISDKMGAGELIKYEKIFNFGSKTGIDLPGESSGILHTEESMNATEQATASFGQGFTCTMVQEISAISAVVNGGYYYQPHVVQKIMNQDNAVVKDVESTLLKQVISQETSDMVRSYMQASMNEGTGHLSKISGYSGGCKTGTAQKIPRGNGKYLVSYVGFWPYENPEAVIYVVVDEPNAKEQAESAYAQYLAKQIMTEVLPYMNIFPDEEENLYPVTDAEIYRLSDFMLPAYGITAPATEEETPVDGDGVEDMNVPEPTETEEDTVENNTLESDGITNDEAQWEQ